MDLPLFFTLPLIGGFAFTDSLERLLSRALVNGEAIQVTLSTGKVYVGFVLEAPDPDLPTNSSSASKNTIRTALRRMGYTNDDMT